MDMNQVRAGQTATQFWQRFYEPVLDTPWTATVNPVLAELAEDLTPGQALDVGCGQGGDSLWLARRGWQVTALDIAEAAVRRVAAQAARENLSDRVRAEQHDLASGLPNGTYDLVNVHYLHTVFDFPRSRILHDLASRIRPDGLLLVVDHASVAPWSWDQEARFPTPAETLATLDLNAATWQTVVCAPRRRMATGPDGATAELTDNVIAVHRRA
jgi:2-polyprenyl-3-methyl-5-hydroxy-6-metoxy-1,4-benzoquinol methylase